MNVAIRTFEWNGDFEACRADADAVKFDTELAQAVGQRMCADYKSQLRADTSLKMGWSLSTSTTFDTMWTLDARLQHLCEHEAKVLFLAASDIFQKLEFGRRDEETKRKDLHARMSRLCEMSAELERHIEKLTDTPEDADKLEEAYQTLFAETLRIYGN